MRELIGVIQLGEHSSEGVELGEGVGAGGAVFGVFDGGEEEADEDDDDADYGEEFDEGKGGTKRTGRTMNDER